MIWMTPSVMQDFRNCFIYKPAHQNPHPCSSVAQQTQIIDKRETTPGARYVWQP